MALPPLRGTPAPEPHNVHATLNSSNSAIRPRFQGFAAEPKGLHHGALAEVPARLDGPAYEAAVAATTRAIAAGALHKAVIGRVVHLRAPGAFSAAGTLERLLLDHPQATVFAWAPGGAGVFVGATPEVLVRVSGGRAWTQALAGTAPADDPGQVAALLRCPKIQREHQLVVDDLRAALEPLALEVQKGAPRLRPLRDVVHVETPIQARLRPGATVETLVDALHPSAALGGAPRAAAREWIAAHEPFDRGWFGGALGWVDGRGDGVAVVGIRAALLRGCDAWAFAGAGIVAGSDPRAEWLETEAKLRTAREALTWRKP